MKTSSLKPQDFGKKWVTVDAQGQVLGRLAVEIARVLRGKHKASFTPHMDCGDNVIVTNADKIVLTGRKWDQKNYYHHTGFIGGIKTTSVKTLLEKHPERIITAAVKGMLPKNKLGAKILGNLRVYAGSDHTHDAQQPEAFPPRLGESK